MDTSDYARSLGVTDADAHTARDIHLSVADCKHLVFILKYWNYSQGCDKDTASAHKWNRNLIDYFKTAV